MNTKNQAAVALGKLGKGHPKNITDQERERRRAWMRSVRQQAARLQAYAENPEHCPFCGADNVQGGGAVTAGPDLLSEDEMCGACGKAWEVFTNHDGVVMNLKES